jgi:ribosome maturation factor RimP
MATIDTLRELAAPIVAALDAEIYDLEFTGGVFRVTVDRAGGVDLETVAEATRQISRQLDLDDPIPGRFTLEVTSPGLERNLRTAEHWSKAVGEHVRVKMQSTHDGERRVDGTVVSADQDTATLDGADGTVQIPLAAVERARTVFAWGPKPKPGKSGATKETSKS